MSYRLIDSNRLAPKYPEVNDMDCIYVDLKNGLDNQFHYINSEPGIRAAIRKDLLRIEAMNKKAEEWKRTGSATPWVIALGILAAWLAFGTVCIIHVIGTFILK